MAAFDQIINGPWQSFIKSKGPELKYEDKKGLVDVVAFIKKIV